MLALTSQHGLVKRPFVLFDRPRISWSSESDRRRIINLSLNESCQLICYIPVSVLFVACHRCSNLFVTAAQVIFCVCTSLALILALNQGWTIVNWLHFEKPWFPADTQSCADLSYLQDMISAVLQPSRDWPGLHSESGSSQMNFFFKPDDFFKPDVFFS